MSRIATTFKTTAVALALLALAQAQAATVTYNDRTSFNAAAPVTTTIDFEAQDNGSFNYFGGSGLNTGGVMFSAPLSGYLYVASPTYLPYQWNSGASLLFGSTNEGGNLLIQFGAGVFSFGMDLMAEADQAPDGTAGQIINIAIGANNYNATTLQRPNRAFFGITSDTALTSMTLTMTNTMNVRALPIIDNVSIGGAANDVPEPGSLALVGLALAGLGAVRRLRK